MDVGRFEPERVTESPPFGLRPDEGEAELSVSGTVC
jgi:hypothetical protein